MKPDSKHRRGKAQQTSTTSVKSIIKEDKQRDEDRPLFFFMAKKDYGEFCQWYPARFTVCKTEIFRLIGHPIDEDDPEAGRFHDTETQQLILETKDPKVQKALGRMTEGFEPDSWDEIKSAVVVAGNMAKFGQNRHLEEVLLGTGDRVLAEAASRDRVWGIGYNAKQAMALRKPHLWGENRLGKALMEVRERLRGEPCGDL